MKLICFPYSLRGEARDWLRFEEPNKYHTWETLSKAFLAQFFSPAKTAKLRNDITSFHQKDGEALYEVWKRHPPQNSPQKSNLESMMENFIATQSKINVDTSSAIQQVQAHNKIIDNQMMAQMA